MKKPLSIYLTGCLFALTLLLAACGSTTSNQTTTANSAPQATPSPTHSSNTSFATYTGKGYTINYRPSWKVEPDGDNGVTFTDPAQKGSVLHVIVSDHAQSALQIEEGTSLKDRCKESGNLLATADINGITWNQGEYRCSPAIEGGSDQEIRTLEMAKPVGNTYYSIAFYATPQNFDNAVIGTFRPMTDSFTVK
jgi:hypothetical protein